MNEMDLYNGITRVDPAFIADAIPVPRRRKPVRLILGAVAAAACVALIGIGTYRLLFRTAASIYVTINPHVCITLNQLGGVTNVLATNTDGATLLDGYSYQNKNRLQVTEELIARAQQMGYLTDAGQVTISIAADDPAQQKKYDSEFGVNLSQETTTALAVRDILSMDDAKQLAMEYFGLTSADVIKIECDAEHDSAVYEVELQSGGIKYECEIEAVTGRVREAETENKQNGQGGAGQGQITAQLTLEQAKTAALQYVGLTTATFTETERDDEDGRPAYELEFTDGTNRYECKVDAVDGSILDFKIKYGQSPRASATPAPSDAVTAPTATTAPTAAPAATATPAPAAASQNGGQQAALTAEQAQAAALAYGGLTDATFYETKQDWDDGRLIYELEFYAGGYEYDCEVDAYTGTILKWETDWDDHYDDHDDHDWHH